MTKPDVRCAIYTRKSTEEGLDQAFNSLDAQREACEAYIQSQTGEGWKLVPARYDDGGFSGGNMERPGLAKLLDDVAAGRVDVVVVYKIDRLTRSLRDFAKIVDQLEKRNASFVSVTQAFNTTTSMGRLTLNVLLSFAQFEREVTAERIRDKIAASRKRGIFMGGCPPLGYDAKERKLVINQTEADTVRHIYKRYLEVSGVADLRADLEVQGILPKQWVSARGRSRGGKQWYIGPLRHILRNRVYIGEATHKGVSYPGEHDAILERELFDAVQAKLDDSRATDERRKTVGSGALLKGLIFDASGYAMSPQRSRSRNGKQHLYYVSQARLQKMSKSAPRPLPSTAIEEVIRDRLTSLIGLVHQQHDDAGRCMPLEGEQLRQAVRDYVVRVDVHPAKVTISCDSTALLRDLKARPGQIVALLQPALPVDDEIALADAVVQVCVPVRLPLRGGIKRIEGWTPGGWTAPQVRQDSSLIRGIAQAHEWRELIEKGQVRSLDELAKQVKQDRKTVQRTLRLAFLAPDIQKQILQGYQPPGVTLTALIEKELPLLWPEQRQQFHA